MGAADGVSRLRKGRIVKSRVIKRSIVLHRHKTSISLEDEFFKALRHIATERGLTIAQLVSSIDIDRQNKNLSSALRVFVLEHYQASIRKNKTDFSTK
jgi:predicted DNA-binding ribbon-helix-helix protein